MTEPLFTSLSAKRIVSLIHQAQRRVFLASPGVGSSVAASLIEFSSRHKAAMPIVVVDCNDEVCRIGYGEIGAIKTLMEKGITVRQCSGLRIGVLICDDNAWTFAPTPLSIEDEPQTDETPNAVRLSEAQAIALLQAAAPSLIQTMSLFDFAEGQSNDAPGSQSSKREIGVMPLKSTEVVAVEKSLETAPPLRFDLQRQVRVFQPYIQYVELSLTGCSISRHTVQIPKQMLSLAADKSVQERLRTTFNLISQNSKLSDKPLQEELEQIRKTFTRSLGKPWGRVMLRNQRDKLDVRLKMLEANMAAFSAAIGKKLQKEIDNSVKQLTRAFLPLVLRRPPDDLLGQIPTNKPTRDQAERWLQHVLQEAFPTVDQVVSEMKLECVYKDVTYESLSQPGLKEALQREYPAISWESVFHEFDAVRAKQPEKGQA